MMYEFIKKLTGPIILALVLVQVLFIYGCGGGFGEDGPESDSFRDAIVQPVDSDTLQ